MVSVFILFNYYDVHISRYIALFLWKDEISHCIMTRPPFQGSGTLCNYQQCQYCFLFIFPLYAYAICSSIITYTSLDILHSDKTSITRFRNSAQLSALSVMFSWYYSFPCVYLLHINIHRYYYTGLTIGLQSH